MKPREIRTIAVIGAGPWGRAMACAAARAGYGVVLEDVSHDTLRRSMDWMREALGGNAALQNLRTAHSVEEACREGDLLIETVPDEMEMKLEIFTLFDKFAKPGAILASHTFSVSVSELAAITFRPELCVGLRFAEEESKGKRLEITRARETSPETMEACHAAGWRMAQEVAVVEGEPEMSGRKLQNHG